jgi:hypothetical protein
VIVFTVNDTFTAKKTSRRRREGMRKVMYREFCREARVAVGLVCGDDDEV